MDLPGGPAVKNLHPSAGNRGLTPGLGRSHMPQDTGVGGGGGGGNCN